MILLGIDLGSSSIKLSAVDSQTGEVIKSAQFPEKEMIISSPLAGWAEQSPEDWWTNFKMGLKALTPEVELKDISAIGISYQMHGLVCIDKNQNILRPSIIWCDSRAVELGKKAFDEIGNEKCLTDLLNSPGNFTASKLAWVKINEPDTYGEIDKVMLPGDYIAMKLTGEINTTISGLSEGMFWDYTSNSPADFLLNYYGIPSDMLANLTPTFGIQGEVSNKSAQELGLKKGVPVTYRAGDQPNNAFSLNVLNPGEIAATAGTSGVVYAITDKQQYDPKSRVNIFAHVNYTQSNPRYGILLCINGTGILNSWVKRNFGGDKYSYNEMNVHAENAPIGSDGLSILPFGNGSERVLENKNVGSQFGNINFNIHNTSHIFRATQEGIAFSFLHGIKIMEENNGLKLKTIRAGNANMFLSPLFSRTLASITQQNIEIYNTDGSIGAARGAGVGAGVYSDVKDAFGTLKKIKTIEPDSSNTEEYLNAYNNWQNLLFKIKK